MDIDGTLGDYHSHFLGFAMMWLGAAPGSEYPPFNNYEGHERFRDWFCRSFNCDLTTFREIKLAYRQGAQKRSMPWWPGTSVLTEGLNALDVEVWVTTTRPYLNLSGIDADTRFWLDRLGLHYDYLLYDENKYEVLLKRLDPARLVAVLDDEAEQLQAAIRAGLPKRSAVLRRTQYNAAVPWGGVEVDSMTRALDLLTTNINAWRMENG